MITAIMQKILEKSSLHSAVVKNANVFDPKSVIALPAGCLGRDMERLIKHTVPLKIIRYQELK